MILMAAYSSSSLRVDPLFYRMKGQGNKDMELAIHSQLIMLILDSVMCETHFNKGSINQVPEIWKHSSKLRS